MTKHKVTQEFMDDLVKWRDSNHLDANVGSTYAFTDGYDIQRFPDDVDIWWTTPNDPKEVNDRLIAILQWLNGEDAFEIDEEGNEIA